MKRFCASPGCPKVVQYGLCEEHKKRRDKSYSRRQRSKEAKALYRSQRWRALKKKVKARDKVCKICEMAPISDIDHIIPWQEGGDKWDMNNLQGLCKPCHTRKTNMEKYPK